MPVSRRRWSGVSASSLFSILLSGVWEKTATREKLLQPDTVWRGRTTLRYLGDTSSAVVQANIWDSFDSKWNLKYSAFGYNKLFSVISEKENIEILSWKWLLRNAACFNWSLPQCTIWKISPLWCHLWVTVVPQPGVGSAFCGKCSNASDLAADCKHRANQCALSWCLKLQYQRWNDAVYKFRGRNIFRLELMIFFFQRKEKKSLLFIFTARTIASQQQPWQMWHSGHAAQEAFNIS